MSDKERVAKSMLHVAVEYKVKRLTNTHATSTHIPNSVRLLPLFLPQQIFLFCQFCVCVVFCHRAQFYSILASLTLSLALYPRVGHTKCKLAHKARTNSISTYTRERGSRAHNFQPNGDMLFSNIHSHIQ